VEEGGGKGGTRELLIKGKGVSDRQKDWILKSIAQQDDHA
jgi:hypothetical protein